MAEAEGNRRHRHQIAQLAALLDREDLDPGDPELAAALVRLGDALEGWFARHEAADAAPHEADAAPDYREAAAFERVHALLERSGVPDGMAVGDAIAAGLLAEEDVERALNPPGASAPATAP